VGRSEWGVEVVMTKSRLEKWKRMIRNARKKTVTTMNPDSIAHEQLCSLDMKELPTSVASADALVASF
jgi:hypothetical protein